MGYINLSGCSFLHFFIFSREERTSPNMGLYKGETKGWKLWCCWWASDLRPDGRPLSPNGPSSNRPTMVVSLQNLSHFPGISHPNGKGAMCKQAKCTQHQSGCDTPRKVRKGRRVAQIRTIARIQWSLNRGRETSDPWNPWNLMKSQEIHENLWNY